MAILKIETDGDWLNAATRIEIESMQMYLYEINTQLESMEEKLIDLLDDEVETIEDERKKQSYHEWLEWHYKEVFPCIFFNSFHVASYSLLESWLRVVADRIGEKQKQLFKVSEIRGAGYLESASSYIKRLTDINISTFGSWWDLKDGQRLRNIIVHSGGSIYKKSDIHLAKKHNVYVASNKQVVVTYDYCNEFLCILRLLFIELFKQTKVGNFL